MRVVFGDSADKKQTVVGMSMVDLAAGIGITVFTVDVYNVLIAGSVVSVLCKVAGAVGSVGMFGRITAVGIKYIAV